MNIEKLFSTKERVEILSSVIYLESEFGVNEIAKKLKLSKGLVSKYFEILAKEHVVRRARNKFVMNKNSIVKSLKIMLNIQKIGLTHFKKFKFVKSVGLYGSCATGTNTANSDVDMWIRVKKIDTDRMAELTSELRKKIGNVKILMLDDKKIELLKRKDPLFYNSLYFGSIILYGEEDGI